MRPEAATPERKEDCIPFFAGFAEGTLAGGSGAGTSGMARFAGVVVLVVVEVAPANAPIPGGVNTLETALPMLVI